MKRVQAPVPELEYVITALPCSLNEHRLPVCIGGTCNGCLGDGTYLVWNSAFRVKRVSTTDKKVAWIIHDQAET